MSYCGKQPNRRDPPVDPGKFYGVRPWMQKILLVNDGGRTPEEIWQSKR
jgi:hypothetical protein